MDGPIFLTGGSGFVGSAIVRGLSARGCPVHALVNKRPLEGVGESVRSFRGSLFDSESLDRAMAGCVAVIHMVGIIMEDRSENVTFERIHVQGTHHILQAAKRNGVKRHVQMSALGSRADAESEYHKTKYAAEQLVRESGLDWTIIRPSMIHGPNGEFMKMEAGWAKRNKPPFLFMPYFGAGLLGFSGAGKLQPVHVDDVARGFVDALENRKTIGEIYPLGGPEQFTWPAMHQIASSEIVGKKRMTLPIPAWVGKFYAAIGIAPLLGFNRDQVVMSQEDNVCDNTKFIQDFGFEPRGFEQSLREYAKQL